MTTSKVANDGLTGNDILESSLGQVPEADHALTAESAQQVDGLNAALIDHQTTGTTGSPVEVLKPGRADPEARVRQHRLLRAEAGGGNDGRGCRDPLADAARFCRLQRGGQDH